MERTEMATIALGELLARYERATTKAEYEAIMAEAQRWLTERGLSTNAIHAYEQLVELTKARIQTLDSQV